MSCLSESLILNHIFSEVEQSYEIMCLLYLIMILVYIKIFGTSPLKVFYVTKCAIMLNIKIYV